MNGKAKSRISIRNLFRIETGKKIILGLLVCAVVFGAYVGVHRLTSKAGDETLTGPKITRDGTKRGNLETIDDIKGKDTTKDIGTPENPFVILEIVPWRGRAAIGYQIEGCEPINIQKFTAEKGQETDFTKFADQICLEKCFSDEKHPASWESHPNEEPTLWGYYEKLDSSDDIDKKRFKIEEYKYVSEGKYEPVFVEDKDWDKDINDPEKKEEALKDTSRNFIWVSYDSETRAKKYNSRNKYAEDSNGKVTKYDKNTEKNEKIDLVFKPGERQYTSRKDKGYFSIRNNEKMWIAKNDFIRETLGTRGIMSRKDVENYCVFVKVIEPYELNDNEEWLDYANMIYMHDDNNTDLTNRYWSENSNYRKLKSTTQQYGNKYPKTDDHTNFGIADNSAEYWHTHQNDITWSVAYKMFKKVNGLEEYSGEYDNPNAGNRYAVFVADHQLRQNLENNNYIINRNIKTRGINYATMEPELSSDNRELLSFGFKNNIRKFLIMNYKMDPKDFYSLFFTPRENLGNKPVIQEINGEGVCTAQPDDGAKIYWNECTFDAYVPSKPPFNGNPNNGIDVTKFNANIFANDVRYIYPISIVGNSYMYPSDEKMTVKIYDEMPRSDIDFKIGLPDALKWFNDESNIESGLTTEKNSMNQFDVIYYMLNYSKGGSPGDIVRRPNSFNILDIEPCKDYSTLTDNLVRLMFPPSKYKSNIHIDRMTVAEFNSSKISLKTNYDVVYIGKDTGKMNSDNKGTVYNDPSLDRNIYMHVGDTFDSASEKGTYRTSGNDFTTPSLEKLVSFARSGNIILLPDEFYKKSSSFNEGTYNNILGKDNVNGNTDLNVLKFLDMINEGEFKDSENITCITEQTRKNAALATFVNDSNTDFVVEWDKDGKEKEVTISNDSAGKYYMDFSFVVGRDVAYDEAVEKAEKEAKKEANGDENKRKEILKNKLKNIKQTKYKVKLLIDKNGDGIFTDDESGSEIVKIYPSPDDTKGPSSDGTYGESSKKDGRYVPYKVTYNLPKNYNRGNVAWKFVIYNTDADKKDAYIERTGVSVYNGRNKATKVNALQIVSDKELDNAKGNLEKQLKDASSKYKKYIDDAKGYEIKVETVSVSQYRDMFKDKDQKFVVDGNAHYYSADLDDYNLVIVSCGDDLSKDITKDDMNSTGNIKYSALAYLAYLDTVDQGVIYTSNTVNGSNTASQKVIKDAFNLSRFTSAGANNSMYTDETKFYHKKKGEYQNTGNGKSGEIEHTYYAVMKDYSNSSKKGHYVYKDSIWGNIQSSGKTLDTQKAVSIDRNNTGAITSYPYNIDPNISIKGAEAQQYVLNLNNPYATVWFTLADKEKQKETYTEKDPETGKEVEKEREKLVDTDKAYGISPRDGANNYYLYNTGNVFYTGIDLSQDNYDEEIKLFINTIVAASGSAGQYPSVTIDDVKDDEKEGGCEPNLQLIVDKNTKKEYQFDALFSGRKAIDAYKEYRPDATSEPTATIKPGDANPTPTPTPTVKPTEKPVTDPSAPADNSADGKKVAVLYNNKFASSDGYYYCKDAEWMKNLPNDAFIQIQYTSIESVSKDKKAVKIEVEGSSGAEGTIILRACENDGSETEDIQKVNVPVSTLKSSLGSAGGSISGLTIRPFEWNNSTVILSVRLIGSEYSGDFSTSSSHNDAKDSQEKEVKEVEKHTHRIFFTACDGILDFNSDDTAFNLTHIDKISIAITDGMYGSETIAVPVEKVYRTTGDTNYMIDSTLGEKDSPNAGKFTKANGTHLINDVQYFIAYDKAYALGGTPYLRFTIENDKHKSVTYLQAVDNEPTKDDVYMFDLD